MTNARKLSMLIVVAFFAVAAGCSSTGENSAAGSGAETRISECPGHLCGILAAQNAVRASAPHASPALPALVWDEALAGHAQAWVDTCPTGHNPDRTVNGEVVGENFYESSSSTPVDPSVPVELWAAEAANYDIAKNTCNGSRPSDSNLRCGHYTQIVWRATLRVGCGMRTGCPAPDRQVWICNYAPAGNMTWHGVIPRPY